MREVEKTHPNDKDELNKKLMKAREFAFRLNLRDSLFASLLALVRYKCETFMVRSLFYAQLDLGQAINCNRSGGHVFKAACTFHPVVIIQLMCALAVNLCDMIRTDSY